MSAALHERPLSLTRPTFKTPERLAVIRQWWPTSRSVDSILAEINSMPGPGPVKRKTMRMWASEFRLMRPTTVTSRGSVFNSAGIGARMKADARFAELENAIRAKPPETWSWSFDSAWPAEQTAFAVWQWDLGKTITEIAAALRTQPNAISGKMHRLKLAGVIQGRPSPIIRSGEPRAPKVARSPRVTLPKMPSQQAHRQPELPDHQRPYRPPPVVLLPPVRPAPVPVIQRLTRPPGKEGCQFPLNEGNLAKGVQWLFCNEPTVELGSPWCAEHRKRCFNRVTLTARADAA